MLTVGIDFLQANPTTWNIWKTDRSSNKMKSAEMCKDKPDWIRASRISDEYDLECTIIFPPVVYWS